MRKHSRGGSSEEEVEVKYIKHGDVEAANVQDEGVKQGMFRKEPNECVSLGRA